MRDCKLKSVSQLLTLLKALQKVCDVKTASSQVPSSQNIAPSDSHPLPSVCLRVNVNVNVKLAQHSLGGDYAACIFVFFFGK